MSYVLLLVVLSAVTYRVGRFIVLDTLIDSPRNKVIDWLLGRKKNWSLKLAELIGCPYCITVWVAAGAVALTALFQPIPYPVWTWLTVATGSLVFWAIIDSE